MEISSARTRFQAILTSTGHQLETLPLAEGVDLMLDFYRDERVDGCSLQHQGDMLLFQWGCFDWGDGEHFELDITRQFITEEPPDDDGIYQFHLTFRFKPTERLHMIGVGERWCEAPSQLDSFRSFIYASSPFLGAQDEPPALVSLTFGNAG